MPVVNIIDEFYNACGAGDLPTVQRTFCAANATLNKQGLFAAVDNQRVAVVEFLLPHVHAATSLLVFLDRVVRSNNPTLFKMFCARLSDSQRDRWMDSGMSSAVQGNCPQIIDWCFEAVYTPHWWDFFRYNFKGLMTGRAQLGFQYLEDKVRVVQQKELLDTIVLDLGATQKRKL